jgi:hypothetical protein
MASIADKARKAKNLATETFGSVSLSKTKKIVKENAKAAGKKLTPSEENRAAKIVQTRRQNDRDRTAARGAGIEKMQAKKATANRMIAAVSGGAPAAKKAAPKPAVRAKAKAAAMKKGKK